MALELAALALGLLSQVRERGVHGIRFLLVRRVPLVKGSVGQLLVVKLGWTGLRSAGEFAASPSACRSKSSKRLQRHEASLRASAISLW
jgi:hypothetical protein